MNSICYVTAYLDIGRENWKTFKRTPDEYFNFFYNYINLFKNDESSFFVFIDKKHFNVIHNQTKDIKNIILIEIDRDWLDKNLPMWKTLEKERDNMNSDTYKEKIKHRNQCPETYIPEYTLINHCKIDFIGHVIDNNLSKSEYYCWLDFAYLTKPELIPNKLVDINKINRDKINYTILQLPTQEDFNPLFTLHYAREVVSGGVFIGNRQKMKEYQRLYYESLDYYQNTLNIADDDQSIILYCFSRNCELFSLYNLHRWSVALLYFSQ